MIPGIRCGFPPNGRVAGAPESFFPAPEQPAARTRAAASAHQTPRAAIRRAFMKPPSASGWIGRASYRPRTGGVDPRAPPATESRLTADAEAADDPFMHLPALLFTVLSVPFGAGGIPRR